jgi:hypothetical protein
VVVPAEALTRWRRDVGLKIAYLRLFELPEEFSLDYSAASLRAVEGHVIDRLDGPDDLADPGEQRFVDGVVAYVGETLMRRGGGAWIWPESAPHPPLVRPDDLLGLAPVSPRALILAALRAEDGERFSTVYHRWERAVRRVRQDRPTWRPVKEPTSADPPDPDSPRLTAWLAERARTFDRWVATYAPEGRWDFTADSLPALEELVRRVTPTPEELHDPSHRDFVEGAAWYLGEVLRRGLGGRWNRDDRLADDRSHPFVEKIGVWESTSTPVFALQTALLQPGHLRAHHDSFAS